MSEIQIQEIQESQQCSSDTVEKAKSFFHALRTKDGQLITEMRLKDGYINATQMCKSAGKLWGDYFRLSSTKIFLQVLSDEMVIPLTGLIEVNSTNVDEKNRSTYVHPDVATNLAQWCSTYFAVKVSQLVRRYATGEITTEESKAAANIIKGSLNKSIPWDQHRLDSIEWNKYSHAILNEYKRSDASLAKLHAMLNHFSNQAVLMYAESTRKFKDKKGIPQNMPVADFMDREGQFCRRTVDESFRKLLEKRKNDLQDASDDEIIRVLGAHAKKSAESIIGLGYIDLEAQMLSLEEAKDRRKKLKDDRKCNRIQPSQEVQVVKNQQTSKSHQATINNYFAPVTITNSK